MFETLSLLKQFIIHCIDKIGIHIYDLKLVFSDITSIKKI